MKKLILCLLSLILTFSAHASTVSGTITNSSGATQPNGYVVFTLIGCPVSQMVTTTMPVVGSYTFTANSSGVWTGTVVGNDLITCPGGGQTQYQLSTYTSTGQLLSIQNYTLTNAVAFNPATTAPSVIVRQPSVTDPLTTQGDLLIGGISGSPTRLPIGGSGTCLLSTGVTPYWGTACSGSSSASTIALIAPSTDFTTSSPLTGTGSLTFNWITPPTNTVVANSIVKRDSTGSANLHILNLDLDPTSSLQAATKHYVDNSFISVANGGTGLNTSGSTGYPYISGGTWSVLSNLGMTLSGVPVQIGGTYQLPNSCGGISCTPYGSQERNTFGSPYVWATTAAITNGNNITLPLNTSTGIPLAGTGVLVNGVSYEIVGFTQSAGVVTLTSRGLYGTNTYAFSSGTSFTGYSSTFAQSSSTLPALTLTSGNQALFYAAFSSLLVGTFFGVPAGDIYSIGTSGGIEMQNGNLVASQGSVVLGGSTPTGVSGQVAIGNTIVAASNCNQGGYLTGVVNCLAVNVSGTMNYTPLYTTGGTSPLGGSLSTSNVSLGTGAGTGATIANVSGADGSHLVSINSGTTPSSSSIIFTVTFTATRGHTALCSITPASAAATGLPVFFDVISATQYALESTTALPASTNAISWVMNCP